MTVFSGSLEKCHKWPIRYPETQWPIVEVRERRDGFTLSIRIRRRRESFGSIVSRNTDGFSFLWGLVEIRCYKEWSWYDARVLDTNEGEM